MKKIIRLTGIPLLFLISLFAFLYIYNLVVVTQVASRLQVASNWDAVRDKLFTELKPGMTREEVHELLNIIGPWKFAYQGFTTELHWEASMNQYIIEEYIDFNEIHAYLFLGEWIFIYDKSGKLIKFEPFDPA